MSEENGFTISASTILNGTIISKEIIQEPIKEEKVIVHGIEITTVEDWYKVINKITELAQKEQDLIKWLEDKIEELEKYKENQEDGFVNYLECEQSKYQEILTKIKEGK